VHVDHNGETDAVTHPDLVRRDEHRDSAIRIVGIRIIPTRCELGSMASSTSTCSSHDVTEFSTLTPWHGSRRPQDLRTLSCGSLE
jgi:hypothetical protein